jgi:Stigma-specific protein, Stig1
MNTLYSTILGARLSCVFLALVACGSAAKSNLEPGQNTTAGSDPGDASGADATGSDDGPDDCGDFDRPCCAGDTCKSDHLTCIDDACGQQSHGEIGKPCEKNSDCASAICVPIREGEFACSSGCASSEACVPGWTCGAVIGQSSDVCQCEAGAETCNERDDDCNGIVDDEPTVGMGCAADMGSGAVCRSGDCACDDGHAVCDGMCAALDRDPLHCGSCGKACLASQACEDGACACPGGGSVCDGTCIDTDADENNCGSCGNQCPDDSTCQAGTCDCPGTTSDEDHCGSCGAPCATGAACSASICTCPAGETVCDGQCVDTATDVDHCMGCGNECAQGQECTEFGCLCPGGLTLCDGACVDTSNDPDHCGGCGNECDPGVSCQFVTGYGVLCCAGYGEPCDWGCCPSLNACSGLTDPPSCVY